MLRAIPLALGLILAAAVVALAGPAAPAGAVERGNTMYVKIDAGGDGPVSQRLLLPLNKAAIVELPADAKDVLVSAPEIADAVIRTPRRVYVLGMKVGQANAFFFDADGDQILNLEIRVERDVKAVQEMIDRLLPDTRVKVEALNDNLVLTGVAPSSSDADAARQIATRFVDEPEKLVSLISVSGKEQVLLKVRMVEMQRTIVKQLGVDLSSSIALSSELALNVATQNEFSIVGRALGGLGVDVDFDNLGGGDIQTVDATIAALERVGLVRTLAEPNLTAISGESAEFLAGGEFPVPAGRDKDGSIIIEYKPFGVGLNFTPVVLSGGRISLLVGTEVSELTNQGAFTLSAASFDTDNDGILDFTVPGATLPGLKVRRATTTVEMPSGGSLVMAGLIQDKTKQSIDGVPGAKDVPGLGALFRARDYESDETELVVIVTPYLVDPVALEKLRTPADGYANPGDLEAVFFGRLTQVYGAPGTDSKGRRWRGPVGFILGGEK